MSNQIDTALVNAFRAGIDIQFQQAESRLSRTCLIEQGTAEYTYFDRIGPTTPIKLTTRHQDTPLVNTPHTRRRVAMDDYVWADLIDDQDRIRMLADPTNPYTQNAVMAMMRQMDQIIIDNADAAAQTGKAGAGPPISFLTANTLQTTATDAANSGGAASNLTIAKLRRARYLLDAAEAAGMGEPLYCVCTASQIQSLLTNTEVTSADFNTVKALVNGEINTFLGFEFIRTELLDKSSNTRDCYAYSRGALGLAIGQNVTVRVAERPDKNHATQVFVRFTAGSLRLWEEKIVKIQCDESVV